MGESAEAFAQKELFNESPHNEGNINGNILSYYFLYAACDAQSFFASILCGSTPFCSFPGLLL